MQQKKNAELQSKVKTHDYFVVLKKRKEMINSVFIFMVLLQFQKWINVIVHPIGNWWKTVKHSIAWRLLEVAKNGDYHERLKAVRQLSRIDHFKGKIGAVVALQKLNSFIFFIQFSITIPRKQIGTINI